MMPEGKPKGRSSPGSSGWASCVLVLKVVVGLFIWEFVGASSSASSSKTPIAVPALSLIRGGIVKSSSGNDNAGRLNAVVVDANDIIDDMALASRQRTDKPERDTSEQVFKSTHVYRPSPTIRRSKRKRSKSRLGREGDSLLRSLKTVTTRTTNGLARAVNVTGTAASVVAGGTFKLAGAAVLDAVDGIEYVSAKSPTEVPGITDTWRLLAKGLRKTGETVYDFGVAAENVTAEATEVAEETIRTVVGSVIDSTDPRAAGSAGEGGRTRGYFSDEEARIIDNMVFGMSSPDGGTADSSGGGGGGKMGYLDGDLSTQFGRDAETRGHHHHHRPYHHGSSNKDEGRDRLFFGQQQQEGLLAAAAAASPSQDQRQQRRRRPRLLFFAARVRLAIRRSMMRTSKGVPTMRFPQLVACGMVFACRAATANPWCGAASFVGARMYLKFMESIYLECLKESMMSDIKFEAVARLHEGSPERARWFNTAVEAMWVPMLEPLLSGWTSRQITSGIERSLPSNVSWVGLGKVTLGPTPPKIRYVQVQNVTSLAARKNMGTSNGVIDSVLLEAGQPGGDIVGENVVYLELGVDWTSVRSKVSLKLGEQSRRRSWWSLSSYVPTYRVKVCDLGIKAKVVVAVAVGDGRPFVKRLWVGFSEPPLTRLSLEALTGMDIANLPVLRKHLRHVVMRCLMPLTEPRYLNIEMKPPAPPPSSYRGAALAARVRPAAAGVRRGVLSRVPGFGLRKLLGRGSNAGTVVEANAAAAAAGGSEDGREVGVGGGVVGPPGGLGGQGRELEEATRRLLVEVGGEFRDETVMAAEVSRGDGDDGDGVVVEDVSRPKADAANKAKAIEANGRTSTSRRAEEPRVVKNKPTAATPSKKAKKAKDQRAENTAVEIESDAPSKPTVPPLPKESLPARLEEADLDWRGNPRRNKGDKEVEEKKKQVAAAAAEVETKAAPSKARRERGRKNTVDDDRTIAGQEEGPSRDDDMPPPPSKGPSVSEAMVRNKSAATTAAAAAAKTTAEDENEAVPTAVGTEPASSTAAAVGAGAAAANKGHHRTRSEQVRERRAEIKRRRAVLREKNGGTPNSENGAVSALVGALRGFWGKKPGGGRRGRSRKANPERARIIQSVFALSLPRPPPPPPGGG